MNDKKGDYNFAKAKQEWREFCETEPSVTLYQQPWYWDATCDNPDDWRVILVKKDREIEAAFPFVYVHRKFMWFIETPWQVPASGIWMRKRREDSRSVESDLMYLTKIVNEVVDQLPYFDRFIVGFNSRLWSWQPFYWRGFKARPHYNMIIRNKSIDQLESSLTHVRRKRIRNARQLYQIKNDTVKFDSYWTFFEKSYRDRKKIISYSKEKLARLFSALAAHEAMRVRMCISEEGVVAENIILVDNERMYHQFGTQMREADKKANSFCVYDAICETMREGKIFDFEGSMIPGVATFNVSFNPEYETLYIITKESARYRAVDGARKTVRAFGEWITGEK